MPTEKKKISATVIADSINPVGNRITTFVVVFPRIILAELNTHRLFSRNSASSRAIPFERMLKMVEEDPFIPIAWQKDHKGMQGTEYFTKLEEEKVNLEGKWLRARTEAVECSKRLAEDQKYTERSGDTNDWVVNCGGVTKQLCNRLLEPFMWHTAIISTTEFENFFALRCPQYHTANGVHKSIKDALNLNGVLNKENYTEATNEPELVDAWRACNKGQAEIHMMALAEAMWDTRNESTPKELKAGEWHIPFGDNLSNDRVGDFIEGDIPPHRSTLTKRIMEETKVKIATARCARVSYLNFEGKDDYEADIKLHDQLLTSGHMSPFEHCAKAMPFNMVSGNFRGFIQYRKMIPGEDIKKYE